MVITFVTIRGSGSWAESIWTTNGIIRKTPGSWIWISSPSLKGYWESLYLSRRIQGPNQKSNPPGLTVRMDIWYLNSSTVSCDRTFQAPQSSPVDLFRIWIRIADIVLLAIFLSLWETGFPSQKWCCAVNQWLNLVVSFFFLGKREGLTESFAVYRWALAVAGKFGCCKEKRRWVCSWAVLTFIEITKRRNVTVLLQHMTGDCSTVWTPALMLLLSGNRQSMWYLSELTDRPCVTDPLGIVSTYTDLEKGFLQSACRWIFIVYKRSSILWKHAGHRGREEAFDLKKGTSQQNEIGSLILSSHQGRI